MAVIFCDSATGNDSDDGSTWALAKATLQAAVTAAGAGGTVYIADTHFEDPNANYILTGPADGNESVRIISSDVLTGTAVEYKKPTAAQIDNNTGNYDITFDGAFAIFGCWFLAGDDFVFNNTLRETCVFTDCTFTYSYASKAGGGNPDCYTIFRKCTFVLNDTTTVSDSVLYCGAGGRVIVENPIFTGTLTYRNDKFIYMLGDGIVMLLGGDYSGFTALAEVLSNTTNRPSEITIDGIKVASGVALVDDIYRSNLLPTQITRCDGNNYGTNYESWNGLVVDEATIVRTSGAGSFSETFSWKVTTTENCLVGKEFYTDWMPVPVTSTGSKTFTVYIANTSADLTDTECWLEVQYLGTSASTVPLVETDRNADILAAGTAQTDDTGSTWGSSPTYMQSLAVTATVNKAGLQRCRVGFAKASATVYVDPMVTVS